MCRFYGRPRCGRCLQWSVATDDDPMVDAEEDAEAPEEELQLRVVVASKVGFATEKLLRSPLLLPLLLLLLLLLLLVFSAGMAEQRLRLELSCVSWVPAWRANALEMTRSCAVSWRPSAGRARRSSMSRGAKLQRRSGWWDS